MAIRKGTRSTSKKEVLELYKNIKNLLASEKYELYSDMFDCPSTEFLCGLW
jgi:hypothetical protein